MRHLRLRPRLRRLRRLRLPHLLQRRLPHLRLRLRIHKLRQHDRFAHLLKQLLQQRLEQQVWVEGRVLHLARVRVGVRLG